MVLVHGWPLSSDSWEYQFDALASAGLRVIAYDRRGFGKSDQPDQGYDYDTLADDLRAVLDGLDVRQATLVGFSMGGGEVVRYVTRGGERASKLALVSSVVPLVQQTQDNPHGVPKEQLQQFQQQIDADRPDFLQTFGKQFYGQGLIKHPVSQGILDWTQFLALPASHRATRECVTAFGTTDFRAELPSVKLPTLVIHGDADKTVPFEATGKVVPQLLPHAQLKVYEGAPHGLFYTHKHELNRDLIAFAKG
ncbi:MAG: alpha/beta hydrolase [Polyangiales bacterium]